MTELQIFPFINVSISKNKFYGRLGYTPNITKISSIQKEIIESYMEEAKNLIRLKGVGAILTIKKITDSEIIFSSNVTFKSKLLLNILKDCKESFLMAATASNFTDVIEDYSAAGNSTKKIIFDAVASELVDSALDWIIKYFNQKLRRENKYIIGKRISAGYGDFYLSNQKIFYEILKLEELGARITEEYILIPEKSVTAITGIKMINE